MFLGFVRQKKILKVTATNLSTKSAFTLLRSLYTLDIALELMQSKT